MYSNVFLVMMLGSSHAAAASSSQRYSASAYFAMYCAAGFSDLPISAIIALSMRVLTEMSTVVIVILCQPGAVSVMCTDSGSHQKLNSRRLVVAQGYGVAGAIEPPMMTSSCARSG